MKCPITSHDAKVVVTGHLDLTRRLRGKVLANFHRIQSRQGILSFHRCLRQMSEVEKGLLALRKLTDPYAKGSKDQQGAILEQVWTRLVDRQGNIQNGNIIMELLFLVFRESIEDTNKEKKEFLRYLKEYNDLVAALMDYLEDLMEQDRTIGHKRWRKDHNSLRKNPTRLHNRSHELFRMDSDDFRRRLHELGVDEGVCFITTACVLARGLADDCAELVTLRRFRDAYVAHQPGGRALIEQYYRIAPRIVAALESRRDRKAVYGDIYDRLVARSVRLVGGQRPQKALENYMTRARELERKFL